MATAPLDVLLLDAECRQTLACLRRYTCAGLRVGVVASASDASWAPSMKSRWSTLATTLPDVTSSGEGYVNGLLELIDATRVPLVVPCYDGSIEVLRARRGEVEARTAVALASEPALEVAVSKPRTLALAGELGIATPRSVRVEALGDLKAALGDVGLPAVVKPAQSWVWHGGNGLRLSVGAVTTEAEAEGVLRWLMSVGSAALIQEWLPGRRDAVTAFHSDGQMWAQMAQTSHREWPTLGGVSVLSETIPLLADIVEPAELLIRHLELEGCSMVEFRRDRFGRPVLMEINPRMGGSLALAIQAGVDFPMLTRSWKLGLPMQASGGYRLGQRVRWLSGDIWNLKSVYSDQGAPDIPTRRSATRAFLADFFRPGTTIDLVDVHDMRPILSEMNKSLVPHAKNRLRRVVRGPHRTTPPPGQGVDELQAS